MIYREKRSVKWYHRPKVVKILLFSAVLLISAVIFFAVKKPEKMEDFSNGMFPETFQTTHRPLQRELKLMKEEGFFEKSSSKMVPQVFVEWYTAPETRLIIESKAFSPEKYSALITKSLKAGVAEKRLMFATPMENPVPGDLFRTLLGCFNRYLRDGDWKACIETLDNMFCYSALLLNSNAADIYFLSKSMASGKQFEQTFSSNPEALRLWNETRRSLPEKYFFTMRGIYQMERVRMCHDFEKIRLHGIRLMDRKSTGGGTFKEGLANGSFSQMWDGISTSVIDAFYDVDRDQTLTLVMLRRLLYEGYSISMMERPDRKMSIHCYRRLMKDSEILSAALQYME